MLFLKIYPMQTRSKKNLGMFRKKMATFPKRKL
jgi:hypothetical protein